jgi:putative flippase GtrA
MNSSVRKPANEKIRFIRFAIVGAIGTVIDFGVLNLLTILLHLPKLYAQAISFTLAVFNNYFLNRHWTYPDSRSKSMWLQFGQFAMISIVGLIIRTPLFWALSALFTYVAGRMLPETSSFKPEWLGNNIALAICIVVVLLWNFFANRLWTFKDVKRNDKFQSQRTN